MKRTAALVGTTGGAGTTRLCVELAAMLAHVGRDVAILDAAFATQGLARHAPGRIDPDLSALLTDDRSDDALDDALVNHPLETPGRLALCPVSAPFGRLARAKTADAARRFETVVAEAADGFDHVLVDTPPVASNPAVAAVNAADRVALVAPATRHGADAVQRMRGRLADVGSTPDAVLTTRAGDDHPVEGAAVGIPSTDERTPACAPDLDATFSPAVARAAEVVFDTPLDVEFPEKGLLDVGPNEYLPDALSNRSSD